MKEVVGEFTQKPVGMTFFRGSKPIDGVWATSDITVCNAAIMPAGYRIGDHQLFVINFASQDIIGDLAPKVVRPASRRLNTKIPWAAEKYAELLEQKNAKHRVIERLGRANSKSRSKRSFTRSLNQLDKELGQYMRYAEKSAAKSNLDIFPSLQNRLSGYAEHRCIGLFSNSTQAASGT